MTVTIYKLTDQDGLTRRGLEGETLWEVGKTYGGKSGGTKLCTNDVYHGYPDPLVAVFMNPIHADISDQRMFECTTPKIVANDHGLKIGVHKMTVVREIDTPGMTTNQRVRAAIYVASENFDQPSFISWADGWLSGKDRSKKAAAAAAEAAAWAAAAAAAAAAAWAAGPRRAAEAAEAWAAWAAEAAAMVKSPIDIPAILRRAMEDEQ